MSNIPHISFSTKTIAFRFPTRHISFLRLYVLTYKKDVIKPWALCKITLKDGYFVHENQHTFFDEDGGQKYFTLAMGHEWTGGDVFDDFC